jgi:uncharacterized protein YrrD
MLYSIQKQGADMSTVKEQQNKWVVSITDGKKLGEVKDVYFDSEVTKVAAILVNIEGLFGRRFYGVARESIQVYGTDAWLVSGSDKVADLDQIPGSDAFVPVGDLRGRAIGSEGGTQIGVVEDILLDAETNVVGFTLSRVFAYGPLSERKTIARAAITSLGSKDSPMTTILAQAESMMVS